MRRKAYWQLTLAQLRIFVRNRQVIFWSLMFPVFFMVMLGSFIGGGGGVSLGGLVLDEDQSVISQQLLKKLQKSEVIEFETFATTAGSAREQALEQLKNGDTQLVLVIPRGYGERVGQARGEEGAKAETEVEAREVAQVLYFYDETNRLTYETGRLFVSQVVDEFSKSQLDYKPIVTVQEKGVLSLQLEYIDFLVPGIVAMMIMSNNLNGVAGQIASWRERGILRRMQGTTLKASTFIAAQITARLSLNGLQAVIVLLVGYFVFGTQVNGSWWLLMTFVVLGTLSFMSIGFIIAGLAKTPESAGPIAGFISFPLLFVGGIFFPIKDMPEFLQPIIHTLPIAQLTTALRQVMNVGADLTMLWPQLLYLGLWTVVAFWIASVTFKWE
jgi:ABC-2 type transport system permease protein